MAASVAQSASQGQMEMIGAGSDGVRLATAVEILRRHACGAIAEAAPDRREFERLALFLAEIGRASDARRQEAVLLSDILGVSALVEAINARRPAAATPNTVPDPFYLPGAPPTGDGGSICRSGAGIPLMICGRVEGLDSGPICGATIETWQASAEGHYDNQRPEEQPEHNLRGTLRSDAAGRFRFRTIRPGPVSVPGDGPVGALLARLGRSASTPAHLNFRVTAPGFQALVTQVFDAADPDIAADTLFAVRPGLALTFEREDEGWCVRPRLVLMPDATEARP